MDPILSIIVPVYNHEKYIAQTLDSIIMQKTKYSFEVLIGEDASTDNSRKILKEYEKKYPNFFNIIYHDENTYKNGRDNMYELKMMARGKYLAVLEGDDYWIDENKIETQIDFLEKNPDYIAVTHNCVVVDENSHYTDKKYPECKDNNYTLKHFLKEIFPGQTATMIARNYVKYDFFDKTVLSLGLTPGDKLVYFTLITHGKIYCIQKVMSAYRKVTMGGNSFSANYIYDYNYQTEWNNALLNFAHTTKNKKYIACVQVLILSNIFKGVKSKQLTLKKAFSEFNKIDNKFLVILGFIYRQLFKIN